MEPWRSLGYRPAALATWLARCARDRRVWVAGAGASNKEVSAVIVVQPEVLLGDFIALLATRPEAASRGFGRALVARAAMRAFSRRRFLYTSADAGNSLALRFYRRLGFARVGRLPDLVRPGRTEILLRLSQSRWAPPPVSYSGAGRMAKKRSP